MEYEEINPDDMPPFLKALFGVEPKPDPTGSYIQTKERIAEVKELWADDTIESQVATAWLRSFALFCDEGLHPERFPSNAEINPQLYRVMTDYLTSAGNMMTVLQTLGNLRMEAVKAHQKLNEGAETPPSA